MSYVPCRFLTSIGKGLLYLFSPDPLPVGFPGACPKGRYYVVTIVNIFSIMIRPGVWIWVILMLAVAAAPAPASAVPAGATMMPMTMPMNGGSGQHGQSPAPGCPCGCGMPLQAAAAVPARTTGAESSPCPGAPVPAGAGIPGTSGRFSGIRRIYNKNVLDHPERAAVYRTIAEWPGIDSGAIASLLAMNRETLRYHLGQLESAMKIVVLRDRGIVRYYENHGRYTLLERKVLQHLWNPLAKEILTLVAGHPGITQVEIAARCAVAPPTVRWYMQRFSADGIVHVQHEGKYTRYSLAPEAGVFVPAMVNGRPDLSVPSRGE